MPQGDRAGHRRLRRQRAGRALGQRGPRTRPAPLQAADRPQRPRGRGAPRPGALPGGARPPPGPDLRWAGDEGGPRRRRQRRRRLGRRDLHAHPRAPTSGDEALVSEVRAPARAREGEAVDVFVTVQSTHAGPAQVRLFADGDLVTEQAIDLKIGDNPLQVHHLRRPARVSTASAPKCQVGGRHLLAEQQRLGLHRREGPRARPGPRRGARRGDEPRRRAAGDRLPRRYPRRRPHPGQPRRTGALRRDHARQHPGGDARPARRDLAELRARPRARAGRRRRGEGLRAGRLRRDATGGDPAGADGTAQRRGQPAGQPRLRDRQVGQHGRVRRWRRGRRLQDGPREGGRLPRRQAPPATGRGRHRRVRRLGLRRRAAQAGARPAEHRQPDRLAAGGRRHRHPRRAGGGA